MILESNFKEYICYKLINAKNEIYLIEVLETLSKKEIKELFKKYVEKNYYIYFEKSWKVKRVSRVFSKEDIEAYNSNINYLIRL